VCGEGKGEPFVAEGKKGLLVVGITRGRWEPSVAALLGLSRPLVAADHLWCDGTPKIQN